MPAPVEARLRRDYDAILNETDEPHGREAILRLSQGADAVLCCPADRFDAELIAALPHDAVFPLGAPVNLTFSADQAQRFPAP